MGLLPENPNRCRAIVTKDWTQTLRDTLAELAEASHTVRYADLAERIGVPPPHRIHKLAEALEDLMREDYEAGRPFAAAVVVSKVRDGLPAPGFFELARDLGRYFGPPDGDQARLFHAMECGRLRESVSTHLRKEP